MVATAPVDDRLHKSSRWPSWMLDAVRNRQEAIPLTRADELADITLPDQPAAAPGQKPLGAGKAAR
jgi:hypothetical protein